MANASTLKIGRAGPGTAPSELGTAANGTALTSQAFARFAAAFGAKAKTWPGPPTKTSANIAGKLGSGAMGQLVTLCAATFKRNNNAHWMAVAEQPARLTE